MLTPLKFYKITLLPFRPGFPCPTLSLLIGFALVYNGFGSNALTISLIVYGLFYGLFGVFRLGVTLDIGLIIGTLSLLVKYIMSLRHIS